MISLKFPRQSGRALRVLALGAHSDDIEIGCGGTLLALQEQQSRIDIVWVVLGAGGQRAQEAERSARAFLRKAPKSRVVVRGFRDGFFPYSGTEVKEYFEELKHQISPDVILTHRLDDRHQDHRMVAELTWNTWRDHLILEYEIPKYDGDFISPNFYVPLPAQLCRKKLALIARHFPSQATKHWFTEDLFWGLLRMRGVESGGTGKYAEGFVARKVSWGLAGGG